MSGRFNGVVDRVSGLVGGDPADEGGEPDPLKGAGEFAVSRRWVDRPDGAGGFFDERFGDGGQHGCDARFAGGHGLEHGGGELGSAGERVGGRAQQVDDAFGGRGTVEWGASGLAEGEALFGQRGDEEVLFGGEVPIDRRRGHPGAGDEIADAQRLQAATGGKADGGVHDLFAAFGLSGVVRAVHPGSLS